MPNTILIHLMGEDPIVAEVNELPDPQDQILIINHPRLRDGNVLPEVQTLIFPWNRVHFIEVMPTEEEEEIIGFIRD
jgi:hypothetical protein